jgi:Histidine kinase-, DNA gyrase B-, and HSP90-like ATPase
VSAPEVRVIPKITGSFGPLSAAVATPLAMVLTELLQNALQHGFPPAADDQGLLEVIVAREQDRLKVTVADNGVGLPDGFDLDSATGLGLQIVRTLVVSELGGRLRIVPRPGGGTEAVADIPVRCDLRAQVPRPIIRRVIPRLPCRLLHVFPGAQPDGAALERAPLVLTHPAPHSRVLPAVDGPVQAIVHYRAAAAYLFGFLDLEQRGTAVPDREEQLGVHLTAGGFMTPVHDVHSFGAGPAVSGCGRRKLYIELVKYFTSDSVRSGGSSFPGTAVMPSRNPPRPFTAPAPFEGDAVPSRRCKRI